MSVVREKASKPDEERKVTDAQYKSSHKTGTSAEDKFGCGIADKTFKFFINNPG